MQNVSHLIEVDEGYKVRLSERLSKYGRVARLAREAGVSRRSIYNLLKNGRTRMSTLGAIVLKLEGDQADINDYIQKL